MKSKILTTLLTVTISLTAFAGQSEGGAGPGGGNANSYDTSARVQAYNSRQTYLSNIFNGTIQRILSSFVEFHKITYIESSKVSALIADLASKGLAEEIKNSKYIFSKNCYEVTKNQAGKTVEIEKDASTLRGVKGAPICLSLSRLLQSERKFDLEDLLGLAMHENVRHFLNEAENDTETYTLPATGEVLSYHPTALYVAENFTNGDFNKLLSENYKQISDDLLLKFRTEKICDDCNLVEVHMRFFSVNPERYSLVQTFSNKSNCAKPTTISQDLSRTGNEVPNRRNFYFGYKCQEVLIFDKLKNTYLKLPDDVTTALAGIKSVFLGNVDTAVPKLIDIPAAQ